MMETNSWLPTDDQDGLGYICADIRGCTTSSAGVTASSLSRTTTTPNVTDTFHTADANEHFRSMGTN